eukprot:Nk52_evm11s106 gene=Nk52_evmTU11s106
MSKILCDWLNNEVGLSTKVTPGTISDKFSNGYLFGEILHKFNLQEDLDQFKKGYSSDAKINNFRLLKNVVAKLDISFPAAKAEEIMQGKELTTTKFIYELRSSIERLKGQRGLNSIHKMTVMSLTATKGQKKGAYEDAESAIFNERIKLVGIRNKNDSFKEKLEKFELEGQRKQEAAQLEEELQATELWKIRRERHDLLRAQFHKKQERTQQWSEHFQSAIGGTTKHRDTQNSGTPAASDRNEEWMSSYEAEESRMVKEDLGKFENTLRSYSNAFKVDGESTGKCSGGKGNEQFLPELSKIGKETKEYLERIRMRHVEEILAQKEREKRRRKVLVDQQRAQKDLGEAKQEDILMGVLVRQSQQERKIAAQLMHARHEKDVIIQNRIFREKQYAERRQKDFADFLDREAELSIKLKKDYEEKAVAEKERRDQLHRSRLEAKYNKHYSFCRSVLLQIVDLTTKVGEYRELTDNLLPSKLMREWTALLLAGEPLYSESKSKDSEMDVKEYIQSMEDDELGPVEVEEKQVILDNEDFEEYSECKGDWASSEGAGYIKDNQVLSFIVNRLQLITCPPEPPAPKPVFPAFPIRAAFIGKCFSGKSTIANMLINTFGLKVLSIDVLVKEAVMAYNIRETEDLNVLTSEATSKGTEDGRRVTMARRRSTMLMLKGEDTGSNTEAELSSRAKLGLLCHSSLVEGKEVEDEVLVKLMAEAIRNINCDHEQKGGWVMDDFPRTAAQAQALEKELTGYDPTPTSNENDKKKKGGKTKAKKKGQLIKASDGSDEAKESGPLESGIDLVVLFELSDEEAIKRSVGRKFDPISKKNYHTEYNRPPEANENNVSPQDQPEGIYERLCPASDESNEGSQIQHRLAAFDEEKKHVEEWFSKFNNLKELDCSGGIKDTFKLTKTLVNEVIQVKLQQEKEKEEAEKAAAEKEEKEQEKAENSDKDNDQDSKNEHTNGDQGEGNTEKMSVENIEDIAAGRESNESAASNLEEETDAKSTGNATDSEQPSESLASTIPVKEIQKFVEFPVEKKLADILVPQWDDIEHCYISTSKTIFRMMRHERERIIRYFFDMKKSFILFLQRPDTKQEFMNQWQIAYNALDDDMRDDPETKAELHRRVEDLKEQLWDISDARKEEAEEERHFVMEERWLEDHLGLITNIYISQMQGEIDRYQDTVQLINDYYAGMSGSILPESSKNNLMLSLVEIPEVEIPKLPEDGEQLKNETAVTNELEAQPEAEQQDAGDDEEGDSSKKRLIEIPLTKRPPYKSAKRGEPCAVSQSDVDEQFVAESYNFGISVIEKLKEASPQLQELDQFVEQKRAKAEEGEVAARSEVKSAKKDKSAITPISEERSPEEESRYQALMEEHLQAYERETSRLRKRLELIKEKTLQFISDLKKKADETYQTMDSWLNERYRIEMKAIEVMVNMVKEAIEMEEKLPYEMVLVGAKFIVNEDILNFELPPPPRQPTPIEEGLPDTFTVLQLRNLHRQFKYILNKEQFSFHTTCETVYVGSKRFVEMILNLSAFSYGKEFLPEDWLNYTGGQLGAVARTLTLTYTPMASVEQVTLATSDSHTSELPAEISPLSVAPINCVGEGVLTSDFVDWKRFIAAITCLECPSLEEILQIKSLYQALDVRGTGKLTKSEFLSVRLWFEEDNSQFELIDPNTRVFNRPKRMKEFLFNMFKSLDTNELKSDETTVAAVEDLIKSKIEEEEDLKQDSEKEVLGTESDGVNNAQEENASAEEGVAATNADEQALSVEAKKAEVEADTSITNAAAELTDALPATEEPGAGIQAERSSQRDLPVEGTLKDENSKEEITHGDESCTDGNKSKDGLEIQLESSQVDMLEPAIQGEGLEEADAMKVVESDDANGEIVAGNEVGMSEEDECMDDRESIATSTADSEFDDGSPSFDYITFLLYFCWDQDPILGLKKAFYVMSKSSCGDSLVNVDQLFNILHHTVFLESLDNCNQSVVSPGSFLECVGMESIEEIFYQVGLTSKSKISFEQFMGTEDGRIIANQCAIYRHVDIRNILKTLTRPESSA